jgi:hypothetical protein
VSTLGMLGEVMTQGSPVSAHDMSRFQPIISTTVSFAPIFSVSFTMRAISPIVMPWRLGIDTRPTKER